MGNIKRKRNMVKRNGKTEGLNVKGLSEGNQVRPNHEEEESMLIHDGMRTKNNVGERIEDLPKNKPPNLLDKKGINVEKFIATLNKNGFNNKHIKTNDGEEVSVFLKLALSDNMDYFVGTVKCIFTDDKFLVLKKMIVAKDVPPSEQEAQKLLLTKKCHYGGLLRDLYSGVKCFYKDNSIYAVSVIPYPPNETDFSILFTSWVLFWQCIRDSHIVTFEEERIGGWYCESE